jgi:electron transport complex protein RnfC
MAEARTGLLSRLARGAASRAGAFGFSHGVHPAEHKELTAHLPIRRMPYPAEVVLPLRQHAGKPARLVVA